MINKILTMWLISLMFRWEYMGLRFEFFNLYLSPDRILFVALIIVFVIQLYQSKVKTISIGKPEIFMVLFFVLCLVSYVISSPQVGRVLPDIREGITVPVREEHKYLASLFNITVYPFLAFIVSRRIKYGRQAQLLSLKTISIIGVYLIVIAMLEHFELFSLVWPKYIHKPLTNLSASRVSGPFADPITMGFMLLLVFLCYMLILSQSKDFRKAMFFVAAASAGVSIYFVYTRSVWLCFAMSLVILTVKKSRMRDISRLIVIGIVVFFLIGVGSKFSFLGKTLFSTRDETVSYRLINYSVALRAFEKNPIFGIGWGRFDSEFKDYSRPGEEMFSKGYDGNHNTFLGIAVEVGTVGIFLFLGILYYMLRTIKTAFRKAEGRGKVGNNLLVCFLALTYAYVGVAFFVDLRYTLLVNVIIFVFGGIVCSIFEDTRKKVQ